MKKNILFFTILLLIGCSENGFEKIIKYHLDKYPEMTTQDVYKLLYQSIFGVKHLLKDTIMAKKYLDSEINSIEAKDEPLFESISPGEDIVRVNLRSFKYHNLSINTLFEVMKISAQEIEGDISKFKKAWKEYENLVLKNNLNYRLDEIEKYKSDLNKIPPEVHHSEIFIKKYGPAYRVVKREVYYRLFK